MMHNLSILFTTEDTGAHRVFKLFSVVLRSSVVNNAISISYFNGFQPWAFSSSSVPSRVSKAQPKSGLVM